MRRFRDDRPADICFARGTFNSHPYVMGAMHEFLRRLETPDDPGALRDLDAIWNGRAAELNRRLREAGLPVQVANLSSIWTVCYTQPSRYNWMLQYYLRAEGLGAELGRYRPADLQPELHAMPISTRSPTASSPPQRPCSRMAGGGPIPPHRTSRSGVRSCARCSRIASRRRLSAQPLKRVPRLLFQLLVDVLVAVLGMTRVDQFAAQQVERRLVVELDIVERVGEDLGHPHQSGLHVLDEEQVHGAEQQTADADSQPDQADVVHEFAGSRVRLEDAEQRRIEDRAAAATAPRSSAARSCG